MKLLVVSVWVEDLIKVEETLLVRLVAEQSTNPKPGGIYLQESNSFF